MKKLLSVVLLMLLLRQGSAQTFSEWFQQKETQKKYLLQQIAALQVYIGHVQKGYAITKQGLLTISDLKEGVLNVHSDHFQSLKAVNGRIGNYSRVVDVIAMQVKVITTCKDALKGMKRSGAFNNDEINYASGVYNRLLEDCLKTVEALIAVTTSGELAMKDEERLKQIDNLYADMQSKYTFANAFSDEVSLHAAARVREQSDIQTTKVLHGIKN